MSRVVTEKCVLAEAGLSAMVWIGVRNCMRLSFIGNPIFWIHYVHVSSLPRLRHQRILPEG